MKTQDTAHPAARRRGLTRREAALGLAAAAATVGRPVFAQAQRVRVGYIADFHGASMVAVANKLELWKKHGLAADVKSFTNGPIQIQALGAGDLDFGYIGPGALWLPITGRAKLIAYRKDWMVTRALHLKIVHVFWALLTKRQSGAAYR